MRKSRDTLSMQRQKREINRLFLLLSFRIEYIIYPLVVQLYLVLPNCSCLLFIISNNNIYLILIQYLSRNLFLMLLLFSLRYLRIPEQLRCADLLLSWQFKIYELINNALMRNRCDLLPSFCSEPFNRSIFILLDKLFFTAAA